MLYNIKRQLESYVYMKFSLLLTGLIQRLLLSAVILALIWAVYFWATVK